MKTLNRRTPFFTLSSMAKNKLLSTTMLTAAGLMVFANTSNAMDDFTTPAGEQVVGGAASFDRPGAGQLNIHQSTQRVIIDWDHFNIGTKAKTEFFQPGSHSLAVNRVVGNNADPTKILGTLKANGQVMVIDRNGVFFGQDSVVDVGAIVVSTGDVANADVMDGDDKFEFANFGNGKIDLNGSITVADAGVAAFVSPFVTNAGVINAKLGKVAMAAGEKVTLDLYGDNLIEIALNDKAGDALLKNTGTINAAGGQVLVTAQAAKAAVDDVINMEGITDVSSVTVKGGKIILSGGAQGKVSVGGTLKANGGGAVKINGRNTSFTGTIEAQGAGANVEISGHDLSLGGTINVGPGSVVTFDPVTFNIGAGEAATIVTALSGGGTVDVSAEEVITLNSTIDSSAQANNATLNFKDEGGAAGLQVDLNDKIILGAAQTLTGDATTVNVSANGLIQNGVDVASTGGASVNVAAGTYNESVRVNKNNITLNGAKAGINGTDVSRGTDESIVVPASPGFYITGSNVTVDGFTINGADNGIFAKNADNVTVKNNVITNSILKGIRIDRGAGVTITGNLIDTAGDDALNVAKNAGAVTVSNNTINAVGDEGIEVHGNITGTMGALTVANNVLTGMDDDGIQIANALVSAEITGNTVSNAHSDGIEIHNGQNTLIDNNTLNSSRDQGIEVKDSSNTTVTNNTINSTIRNEGIYFYNVRGKADISDNTVNNTAGDGIHVESFDTASINNNTIDETGDDGIEAVDGNGVSIINNTITNAGYGEGGYYGHGDYYGADGIHVRYVGDYYGYGGNYRVDIEDNDITTTADDGIEVIDSGRTLIGWNDIENAGAGNGYYGDYYGADGIHVRDVVNDSYYGYYEFDFNELALDEEHEQGYYDSANGFAADIVFNDIDETGDDGIEVLRTESTWIEGNEINNAGVGYGYYYGGGDYTGADGIHVENVYGLPNPDFVSEKAELDTAEAEEDFYGPFGVPADYSVVIVNNAVDVAADDGIEVIGENSAPAFAKFFDYGYGYGTGRTLIAWNEISEAGYGTVCSECGGDDYGFAPDGYGADGIHVRGVFADDYYGYPILALATFEGEEALTAPDGYGYSVEILGNDIDTVGDDGIEVLNSGKTLVADNDVSYTGLDTYAVLNTIYSPYEYYNNYGADEGDGIHVENVHTTGYVYGLSYNGVNSVEILNNRIDHTGDDGIEVRDSGQTTVADNHVRNAGFNDYGYGYGYGSDYYGADGIHLNGISGDTIMAGFAGTEDGGEFYGYAANVLNNTVDTTGDDGIEVVYADSAYIKGNNVSHSGVGNSSYYGGADWYGADGIHVRDVYGDYYGYGVPGTYEGGEFTAYAVVVKDNTVDTTQDDGIEVIDSGRTLIKHNTVSNAGAAGGGYYGYYGDGWGADGIHVRNVRDGDGNSWEDFGDFDLGDLEDIGGLGDIAELIGEIDFDALDFGGESYDVEVVDNTVTNSADDGIEVTYNQYAFGKTSFYDYGYDSTVIGILHNTVSNSGDDGIDVTNGDYVIADHNNVSVSGGDGITINRDGSDDYYGEEDYYGYDLVGYDGYYGYGSLLDNAAVVTNNTVDQSSDDGVEVQGYGLVLAANNTVTNSGDDGINIHELLFGGPVYAARTSEVSLIDPFFGIALVIAAQNTVDQSGGDGIQVDSAFYHEYEEGEAGSGASIVLAVNNAVTGSGDNGFYASGPDHGYTYVAGNAFENNTVGANFESGTVDLTGSTNFFFGGDVGLLFRPFDFGEGSFAHMSLVDNDAFGFDVLGGTFPPANFGGTIGEQFFSGQSQYFVQLANGAFFDPGFPTILNGLDSTYNTPDGQVRPSDTGGILSPDVFAFLESRFFHYTDDPTLGLFFFGVSSGEENADIDQKDIFNTFGVFEGDTSGLNITLLGLPGAGGGGGNLTPEALNAIQTFAGDTEDGNLTPDELNQIQSSAGGNNGTNGPVHCWSDAINAAYTGHTVNYSYNTGTEDTLAGAAACGGGSL